VSLLELLLLIRAMDRGEHPGWEYDHIESLTEPYIMAAKYRGIYFVLASIADFRRTKTAIEVGARVEREDAEREARAKGE